METINLKARYRTGVGKTNTNKVRKDGWIPAVYYGHDRETKHLEIDYREFAAIVRSRKTTHLINLVLPNETDTVSIIKEIQRNVLNNKDFYHIDFQHVAMDEKITVQCPIHVIGVAIGVKEEGGIFNQSKRLLTVECFPASLPEFVEVDVSELHIGHSIHVRDLSFPDLVIKDSPEEVIAVVVHPQAVVEETPVAAEGAEVAVVGEEGAAAQEGAQAGAEKSDEGPAPKK